jgi:hypothetical protein
MLKTAAMPAHALDVDLIPHALWPRQPVTATDLADKSPVRASSICTLRFHNAI